MGDYDEPGSPGRALQRLSHGAEEIYTELTEAHEWYCPTCKTYYRLEFAPLCISGAECGKCKGAVDYNGIVIVPKSRVKVVDSLGA